MDDLNKESGLINPEFSRMAAEISELEDHATKFMEEFTHSTKPWENVPINPSRDLPTGVYKVIYEDKGHEDVYAHGSFDSPFMRKLGRGHIEFGHLVRAKHLSIASNYALPGILGVKSPNILKIGVHTDNKTKQEVLSNPDYLEKAETFYFFDKSGKYAKAVVIPKGISDDRPLIRPIPTGIAPGDKLVQSDMDEGDLELAKEAMKALISEFTRYSQETERRDSNQTEPGSM